MNTQPVPRRRSSLPLLLTLTVIATLLLYRNGEKWSRRILLYLSQAAWAREIVSNLPVAQRVASRFVAGTDRAAAMNTVRALNNDGLSVTLDYLGESVANAQEAAVARNEIILMLDDIASSRVDANISVKLSQLGLNLDEKLAEDNIRQIVKRAAADNLFVRIDMEDHTTVDATLRIQRQLKFQEGLGNVGVVIQAYLYRSEDDIADLIAEGTRVRLCKGAYAEPADVAFPIKADTDANYIKLARTLLAKEARDNGVYTGLATHDERIIREIQTYAQSNNIPADSYEFQMLYGIRRDLQDALVRQGHRVRVYVPYGMAWYPYFMRRLAERPANLWFFISNFFRG